MPQPIPYLGFNGNCAEAMKFYEKVLNGKIELMLTFKDMPAPPEGAGAPASSEGCGEMGDGVMHARLNIQGTGMLFAGDCPPNRPYGGIHGISLALMYETVSEAEKVFKALSEGGTVGMPMGPTFWAKSFGMVIDKFGVAWMVNGEPVPHDQFGA